jgi:hypothetical protein
VQTHIIRKLLQRLLGKHLEGLDAVNKLPELNHLLVDKPIQKGQILMPVDRQQLCHHRVEFLHLLQPHLRATHQLPRPTHLAPVSATPLQHNHHHLIVYLEQLHQLHLTRHTHNQTALVQLEKFYVLEEQSNQVVLVLDTVEGRNTQELVKLLFRTRQLYLQITHEDLVRQRVGTHRRFCIRTVLRPSQTPVVR